MSVTTSFASEHQMCELKLLTIADEERRRIGHELHDVIGQELLGLAFMCGTLIEALREHSSADINLAEKLRDWINVLIGRVRNEAWGLIPMEIQAQEFITAMSDLSRQANERFRIQSQFVCDQAVTVKANLIATNLYRIAQEAITNAIKHAQAQHITVTLSQYDDQLVLQVLDDGRGLPEANFTTAGQGMQIMRFRAGLINATLDIQPAIGGGVKTTCIVKEEKR